MPRPIPSHFGFPLGLLEPHKDRVNRLTTEGRRFGADRMPARVGRRWGSAWISAVCEIRLFGAEGRCHRRRSRSRCRGNKISESTVLSQAAQIAKLTAQVEALRAEVERLTRGAKQG